MAAGTLIGTGLDTAVGDPVAGAAIGAAAGLAGGTATGLAQEQMNIEQRRILALHQEQTYALATLPANMRSSPTFNPSIDTWEYWDKQDRYWYFNRYTRQWCVRY